MTDYLESGERVYLGLGSNLGDREANLRRALVHLGESVSIDAVSSIYETDPWGYEDQPAFLNCACGGVTNLDPQALLAAVKDVEAVVGRKPTFRYGPRMLDIDVLFYGQLIVGGPELEVPHPGLPERAFVLAPLAEIAPDYPHPISKLTVAQLLERLPGNCGDELPEGVRPWAPISTLRKPR